MKPADLLRESAGRRLALFLDYDGTLAPIVERPEDAVLAPETRSVLQRLARRFPIAVVSGRDLEDVRARVGVEGISYAGCHGFEIAGPHEGHVHAAAAVAVAQLDAAADQVAHEIRHLPGVQLERKRYSLAVHTRRAREADEPLVREAVERARASHPALRVTAGKKVLELLPNVDWDKGRAVLWLMEKLKLEDALPVYIGDDVTDEDAFRALAGRGVGIAVQAKPAPTAARERLADPGAVREFLAALAGA